MSKEVRAFNESSYRNLGFAAQRRYPNEELLRFIGSNYFRLPLNERAKVRVLEVGCGSGTNLWMLAREGFTAHGLDFSKEGLKLARKMLESWGVSASLDEGSMTDLPYAENSFDVVVDVFSSYSLDEAGFACFAAEVARVLKSGGKFFSYTPSKASDVFKNPAPAARLDASTIDGFRRETAPFYGNFYPVRFASPDDVHACFEPLGLTIAGLERIGRTYRNGEEYFEFLSYHARRIEKGGC